MAARASAPPLDWAAARGVDASAPSLATLDVGAMGMVVSVGLEDDLVRWLAAIGIGRGDRLTVLRRAPFGGPVHVRRHGGGEVAIDRTMAGAIAMEPLRLGEPKGAV